MDIAGNWYISELVSGSYKKSYTKVDIDEIFLVGNRFTEFTPVYQVL